MRLAFFLLVLLNLIFYVWSAGYLGGQDEGREPQRAQNQMQPEKIVVTPMPTPTPPADGAPAATPSPSAPPAEPAPAPAPAAPTPSPTAPPSGALPTPAAAPVASNAAPAKACRWIEGVAAKDAGMLQQSMQKAGLAVAVLPMDERSFWINIPALPNKAAADKKASELKQLGIGDFHVMQGAGGLVISLGVFGDEASASQFLQGLVKKGVRSARMDTRTKPASALRLELRGPSDLLAQRLPQLLASAPGSRAAACP